MNKKFIKRLIAAIIIAAAQTTSECVLARRFRKHDDGGQKG